MAGAAAKPQAAEPETTPKLEFSLRASLLKGALAAIAMTADDFRAEIGPKGWHTISVDGQRVMMVDVTLPAKSFETKPKDEATMILDGDKLRGILKFAGPDDLVTLQFDGDKNRLTVKFGNLTRRLPLIGDVDIPNPKIPNITLDTKATIATAELTKAVAACEQVGDIARLRASPEAFEVYGKGDVDEVSARTPKDELKELTCPKPCSSCFSLKYFKDAVKAVSDQEAVTLEFHEDYPVKLTSDLGGKGSLMILIAPRIEDENWGGGSHVALVFFHATATPAVRILAGYSFPKEVLLGGASDVGSGRLQEAQRSRKARCSLQERERGLLLREVRDGGLTMRPLREPAPVHLWPDDFCTIYEAPAADLQHRTPRPPCITSYGGCHNCRHRGPKLRAEPEKERRPRPHYASAWGKDMRPRAAALRALIPYGFSLSLSVKRLRRH